MIHRRTFLGTLTGGLLTAPLAAEAQQPAEVPISPWLDPLILFLVAGVVFLLFTGFVAFVSSRRRRRKLAKILVPLAAGAVCGALWILLVNTAATSATPKVTNEPAVLLLGGVMAALVVGSLLSVPTRLGAAVGLSMMAIGFHSLALPIAALISIVVGGSRAANLRTVALSIGGLLSGVLLVFVGDRVFRRRSRRWPRARLDLS